MGETMTGILGLAAFLVLLAIGLPIAFSAIIIGLLGILVLAGPTPAFGAIGSALFNVAAGNYVYAVIPLFILMGFTASNAGFATDLYKAARAWVGHLPGGIALATIFGGTAFAAVSGVSLSSAAMLTKMALPEMEKYRYSPRISTASIIATGTLAVLIPPSNLIVIYGIMTEQSIGRLLIAGILPGVLASFTFVALIIVRVLRNPLLAPRSYSMGWNERLASLWGVWPLPVISILIIGGIYGGLFTPTEAGAVGALCLFIMGFATHRLKLRAVAETLSDTGRTTAMIFIILVGVLFFSRFIALSRIANIITEFVIGLPLPPLGILIAVLFLLLIMGMLLDAIGILVLAVPIIYPAALALGFDPIWFGIIVVMMCEIGMITPPVGITTLLVRGLAPHISSKDIFLGVWPFIGMFLICIGLIIAFPQIVLFLPGRMFLG